MNFGIIGLGVMGSNHKRVYEKLGHNVVEIYDPYLYKEKAFNQFIEGCVRQGVQAISICNPSDSHVSTALEVFQNLPNIFLLIEKPISTSLDEAVLLKAFQDRILVGHVERFNVAVVELLKLIKNGFFGKVHSVRTKRGQQYYL